MIKHDLKKLLWIEEHRPGFIELLLKFDSKDVPPCWHCESTDTAVVQCGIVGMTIALAGASTKFHLLPNYNGEGIYFCNSCRRQFGPRKFSRSDERE